MGKVTIGKTICNNCGYTLPANMNKPCTNCGQKDITHKVKIDSELNFNKSLKATEIVKFYKDHIPLFLLVVLSIFISNIFVWLWIPEPYSVLIAFTISLICLLIGPYVAMKIIDKHTYKLK